MSYEDEFDWGNADADVPHQARIAVYTNPEGHIVIRQEGDWYRKEDPWIVVLPENAKKVADAIMALAEPVPTSQLALPAPTDRTAAERQRRHRNGKGNGSAVTPTVTGTVTDRDSTVTRNADDRDVTVERNGASR